MSIIDLERLRLGLNKDGTISKRQGAVDEGDYRGNFSIIPLFNVLKYLECRAFGNPTDTVNHVHDQPFEATVTVSIRGVLEKALQKALNR